MITIFMHLHVRGRDSRTDLEWDRGDDLEWDRGDDLEWGRGDGCSGVPLFTSTDTQSHISHIT